VSRRKQALSRGVARRNAKLSPYLPEGPWTRLRHLGARRAGLLVRAGAARQGLRDLIECARPALLDTAARPLDPAAWRAALAVSAHPGTIAAMSEQEFLAALTTQVKGGRRPPDRPPRPARAGSPPSGTPPWNAPASPATAG